VTRYVVQPRDASGDRFHKFTAQLIDTWGEKQPSRMPNMTDAQKEADRLNLFHTREAAARACRHLVSL
jgi:hypothetical protein